MLPSSRLVAVPARRLAAALLAVAAVGCTDHPATGPEAPPPPQGQPSPGPAGRAPYVPNWTGPALELQQGVPVTMDLGSVDEDGNGEAVTFDLLPPPPHKPGTDTTAVVYPSQADIRVVQESYNPTYYTISGVRVGMGILRVGSARGTSEFLLTVDSAPGTPELHVAPTTMWRGDSLVMPLGGLFDGHAVVAARDSEPRSWSVTRDGDGVRVAGTGGRFTVAAVGVSGGTLRIKAMGATSTLEKTLAIAVVMPTLENVGSLGEGTAFSIPAGVRVPITLGAVGPFGPDGLSDAVLEGLTMTVTSGAPDLVVSTGDGAFSLQTPEVPDFFVTATKPGTYTALATASLVFTNPTELGGTIRVPVEAEFTFSADEAGALAMQVTNLSPGGWFEAVPGLPSQMNVRVLNLPSYAAVDAMPEVAEVLPIEGHPTPDFQLAASRLHARLAAPAPRPGATADPRRKRAPGSRMRVTGRRGATTLLAARAPAAPRVRSLPAGPQRVPVRLLGAHGAPTARPTTTAAAALPGRPARPAAFLESANDFPLTLLPSGTGRANLVLRFRASDVVTMYDTVEVRVADLEAPEIDFRDLGLLADTLVLVRGWPTMLIPEFGHLPAVSLEPTGSMTILPGTGEPPTFGRTLSGAGRVIVGSEPGVHRLAVTLALPPQVPAVTDTFVLRVVDRAPPRVRFDSLVAGDTLRLSLTQVRAVTLAVDESEPSATLPYTFQVTVSGYGEADGNTLPPFLSSVVAGNPDRFDLKPIRAGEAQLCPILSFLPSDPSRLNGGCLTVQVYDPAAP